MCVGTCVCVCLCAMVRVTWHTMCIESTHHTNLFQNALNRTDMRTIP